MFLRNYILSVDRSPYAINAEQLPASSNLRYPVPITISPVEGARIAALMPIQGSELGTFTGANFQGDVPRQMAVILRGTTYVVYENPKQLDLREKLVQMVVNVTRDNYGKSGRKPI